ncbi:MAG: RnfABCDGE type electron transport complex subunit D, partial [Halieaceae bacterium]
MSFLRITSPHGHGPMSTAGIMQTVLVATVPGIIALTWFFGPGTLVNIVVGGALALAFEAGALALRDRSPTPYLKDYSVLVTSTLLCIALPPYSPWWLIATGIFSSVILGKHVFGGLGYNPFNPAMVGYVILLISFPLQMSTWQAPRGLGEIPGVLDALTALASPATYDAVTMATPLDVLRQNQGLLMADLQAQKPQFGLWAGVGWEWVNIAFLAGGVWLLYKRIFTWHAPVGLLLALGLCAAIGFDSGSSESGGSPLLHWLSGATMFG